MAARPEPKRTFSLEAAQRLLPTVKRLTAEAVRDSESLAARLRDVAETDPEHDRLVGELNEVLGRWAGRLQGMHLEVKGLWLVDFDNGEGYYCWSYPEDSISYYHAYDDGFARRVRIM